MSQSERLRRISESVTLRDDLQAAERRHAGRENALGFQMRVWERTRDYVKAAEWAKAFLSRSPVGVGLKSFTTVLEKLRSRKDTSAAMKRLLLATEALVFWGKFAFDVAKTGTPLGAASVVASVSLKAVTLLSLSREEKLRKAMDYYWQASQEFQRLCSVVVAELNREIDGLR